MPTPASKKLIKKLNGYPAWAAEQKTRDKIDTLTDRLIELSIEYEQGMHDKRRVKKRALEFISELLDVLHLDNPETLIPTINSYHIKPEFLKLLLIADQVRKGETIEGKLLTKSANDIRRIQAANNSPERNHPNYDAIVTAANAKKKARPNLSTSKVADLIQPKFLELSSGRIRNILNPLKNKI